MKSETTGSGPRSAPRERIFKLLAVVLSLALVFAAAEIGLRMLARFTPYIAKVSEYETGHYLLGKALIPGARHVTRSARISVNSRGFRGREFEVPKPAGVYRIFALGGSTTFGYYPSTTGDEWTYPALLEVQLNAVRAPDETSRYEVVNAGAPGYSVRSSIQNFAARILFYEPDMVIVYHNINDLSRYGHEQNLTHPLQNQYIPTGFRAGLLDHLFGWSYAVQELRFTLTERIGLGAAPAGARRPDADDGSWKLDPRYPEAFRRDLRNLVVLARANGVIPVLASQSFAVTEGTDFARLTDDERRMQLDKPLLFYARVPARERYRIASLYNDIVRQVAEAEGVPFVDVHAGIPKTPEYHWDYCHLTDRGSALQAEIIARELHPLLARRAPR